MYGDGVVLGNAKPMIKKADGLQIVGAGGYGNTDNPSLVNGAIATVGAGSILAGNLPGNLIYRTGPTAAFIDTFDTAANLDAGIGGGMDPGDAFQIWYSNQVAFAATIAGNTGVTLSSTKTSIAASALGCLVLLKVANAVLNTPPAFNSQGQPAPTFASAGVYKLFVL